MDHSVLKVLYLMILVTSTLFGKHELSWLAEIRAAAFSIKPLFG